MTRKQRYADIIAWFQENMPIAETELDFKTPFQLLTAVILSAQCTDKRVNMVTPALFERYPDAESMSQASIEEIYELIKSISYPNNKSQHLYGMSRKLMSDFGGEVPSDRELLMTLPGVGRKTANVVGSIIFSQPFIAVDTHVFRVSHRLGLSSGRTPIAVETDLEKHIPDELRGTAHHWLILHGRYTCTALRPHCSECGLSGFCRYFEKNYATSKP